MIVSGRVQGVFYRQSCADLARARGVGGWVRNLPDGRVEAVFEGPSEAVEAMVAWAREGPPWAVVEGVEVHRERPRGDEAFHVSG